jgi:hypothetical protein
MTNKHVTIDNSTETIQLNFGNGQYCLMDIRKFNNILIEGKTPNIMTVSFVKINK